MVFTPIKKKQIVKSQADFRISAYTGLVTGTGAAADIFSARWAETTRDCIIWWFKFWYYITTGFTAGQWLGGALYLAHKFTVSPSTATSLLPGAGMNRKKTGMPDSLWTAIQLATTGAIGTPGTRTLDTLPIMQLGIFCPTTTLIALPEPIPVVEDDNYLAYLTANEGIVLQLVDAMGAAGVAKIGVEFAWSEVVPDALGMPDNLAGF